MAEDNVNNEESARSEYLDENGKFKKGNKGRQKGSLNRATRFKNKILDILEDRADELSKQDIIELAKIGAKFVPKSLELSTDSVHNEYLSKVIGKSKDDNAADPEQRRTGGGDSEG